MPDPRIEPRDEPSNAPEPVEAEPAPLPPLPAAKPAVTNIDVTKLTGLTPRQAERLLGPPDHRSEQPPATVWSYDIEACRLELFFYFDLESQQQRSLAYDLHTVSGAQGAKALCLVRLAQRGQRHRPLQELLDGVGEEQPDGEEPAPQAVTPPVPFVTDEDALQEDEGNGDSE